jgi:membrane associated rhomboid family serine protease
MLHGGLIHFAMNGLGLLYLGKRVEVFARWPHVPMVFLFSAMVGGEASARLMDATSVGASGGLMGWLGFLLVFETLHGKLVPRSAKRRLIGGVLMTALIGLIGYRFIDNAAHFGGLLAGMAYAGIVFPKSSSVLRPKMNATDRIIGIGSLVVLGISAIYAISKIWG